MDREKQFDLDLKKLNDYIENKCGGKEYYFGCWSAEEFSFEVTDVPSNIQLECGNNWLVLRNGADVTDGLIFTKDSDDEPELVVFRGYLADESLHSYSKPSDVKAYWSRDLLKRHNGIFAAATITDGGQKLNIITDVFGIGPIYTRILDGIVFFSSAPGLLSCVDDEPDMMAWYMRLLIGNVPGRKSLSKSIELTESSSITTFTSEGQVSTKWNELDQFSSGEKPVNDETLEQSEKYFSNSIEKCLKLKNGNNMLPLSGGFDSRRIFAHLIKNDADFETITVQMPTSTGADIDAKLAANISSDYQIKHKIFKYPSVEQWHKNTKQRILSLDALCYSHTWSVPLFKGIDHQICCIYDGVAGDTFVGDGWRYKDFDKDLSNQKFPKYLNSSVFPTAGKISSYLSMLHNKKPSNANRGLFSYVLWHTRRNTGLWSQQQARPGQLVVCPYFDLDYINAMFRYVLEDGDFYRIQRGVLEKYWKKLAAYPSTRNLPDEYDDLTAIADETKDIAFREFLKETKLFKTHRFHYSQTLNYVGQIIMRLNALSRKMRDYSKWWAIHISELTFWWQNRPSFIKLRTRSNVQK